MSESPSPLRHPEPIAKRRAYTGRIISVDEETLRTPGGAEFTLEMIRHQGAAAVVALLDDAGSPDPHVLLIRQYRYAASGEIWEIPAGVLEPGEKPEDCARRELREEAGAKARHIAHLTTVYTTPGFTDEQIHLFLATGVTAGEPNHAMDEFIQVEARPMSTALEMIRDGEIVDAKTIVALLYTAGYRLNQ